MLYRLTVTLQTLGAMAFLLAVTCLLASLIHPEPTAVVLGVTLLGAALLSLIGARICTAADRRALEKDLRALAAASRESSELL